MSLGVLSFAILGYVSVVAAITSRHGLRELTSILSCALWVGHLFAYARRRQHDAWETGVQLSIVVFGAGWLDIALLRLMVPSLFDATPFFGPALAATVIVAPIATAVTACAIRLSRAVGNRRIARPDER